MRTNDHLRAPDDRSARGRGGTSESKEATFSSEESAKPERKKSGLTPPETPRDTKTGDQRISGPGPNDLTRGLP